MEEAKAAAYYEELTRKGEGAARFKQGLGFSTTTSSVPCPPRPSPSSSSPFSNFIRASSPGKAEKQAQLKTIQAKLRRLQRSPSPDLRCQGRERDISARRRSTSRERRRERDSDRSSRNRYRRRNSRSYSSEEEDREERRRSRSGRRERYSSRRENKDLKGDHSKDERSSGHRDKLDYSRLIEGYSLMTPAERVKAKMKLQLSQTAANDSTMAMSNGWERFDFNKNAPLDDDDEDEIEVAGDDASLVKKIGNSFRFSAVQAKREEEIKAAHDEAMFGASAPEPIFTEYKGDDDDTKMANNEKQDNNILISDKVLEKQQGSWRDRVGKFKSGFDS